MSKIQLKNVTKSFGDVVAVNNLSLNVEDKGFTTLLGPSGCGKTTTLRLIAGLEEPTNGKILFDGEDVTALSSSERNIAMVFQTYALYPHMTVYENIEFPLKVQGVDEGERNEKVRSTAKFLRIADLLDRNPGELSGGQRQRVALGRAIIREPRVFLMDEPLSNLDAKLRMQMRVELKKMQEELGITTVYVTHDQIEAMSMGQRIVAMKDGSLQQAGTPKELFTRPQNTWVASFIGTPPMNILESSLEQRNNSYFLEGNSFSYQVDDDMAGVIMENDTASKVSLGVRPGDLEIKNKVKNKARAIKGKVYAVEPTGEDVIVDVKVGDEIVKVLVKNPHYRTDLNKEVYLELENVRLYGKSDKILA